MAPPNIWANNGGIYLGYACDNTEGLPTGVHRRPLQAVTDRHVFTLGPNGAGKSRRLLVPNLANLTDWSIVVVDIKAELTQWTAEHRRRAGNKIVALNPFHELGLASVGFNPVAALDPTSPDFIDDAFGLAEAMIQVEGREPHWSASAQDLLCALIMFSRLTGAGGGSLGHVRELLGKSSLEFVEVVKAMMKAGIVHDCEELTIKAARFRDLNPENRELNAICSTAMTQTRWLDSRAIKADLARGAFDFSSLKETPTTVYLSLPANRLGTHAVWLRIIITAILQKLLKGAGGARVPTLLMIDEAAHVGALPALTSSMAMMRGYGIKLWSVYQDYPQAKATLGAYADSFIANAGILQAFAPQDMTTASFLSERAGQTTAFTKGYSSTVNPDTGFADSENLTITPTAVPTMLPLEIMNMDEGYSIMFTHRTKGIVRAFLPDPSWMAGFQDIGRDPPRYG